MTTSAEICGRNNVIGIGSPSQQPDESLDILRHDRTETIGLTALYLVIVIASCTVNMTLSRR